MNREQVGYISNLSRMYLGNPESICILTFPNSRLHKRAVHACTTHNITWEILLEHKDTDTVVQNTILVTPDDSESIFTLAQIPKDGVEISYRS